MRYNVDELAEGLLVTRALNTVYRRNKAGLTKMMMMTDCIYCLGVPGRHQDPRKREMIDPGQAQHR